jgi:hypothetical protein
MIPNAYSMETDFVLYSNDIDLILYLYVFLNLFYILGQGLQNLASTKDKPPSNP